MKRNFFNNIKNDGQAAVEYLMLTIVMVIIITTILGNLKGRILDDCATNPKSFMCSFEKVFNLEDMRYFRIMR